MAETIITLNIYRSIFIGDQRILPGMSGIHIILKKTGGESQGLSGDRIARLNF